MSVDRLRDAAAKVREHAEKATPGPWELVNYSGCTHYVTDKRSGRTDIAVESVADAAYLALMAPPVALALAAWLSDEATLGAARGQVIPSALAVADTILGGAS